MNPQQQTSTLRNTEKFLEELNAISAAYYIWIDEDGSLVYTPTGLDGFYYDDHGKLGFYHR
jgi:hypothetical protein